MHGVIARIRPLRALLFLGLLAACESNSLPPSPNQGKDGGTDDGGGGNTDVDSGEPLDGPIPGCTPTTPPTTGDIYQDCVNRINQLRADCQHLPPLQRWNDGEDCADMHAEYDSTRPPHSGFSDGICENGGWAQNECPGWNSPAHVVDGCLQLMWDEGPGEPFEEHGHYINMSNPDYTKVACGFFMTPGGEIWAVQNFK